MRKILLLVATVLFISGCGTGLPVDGGDGGADQNTTGNNDSTPEVSNSGIEAGTYTGLVQSGGERKLPGQNVEVFEPAEVQVTASFDDSGNPVGGGRKYDEGMEFGDQIGGLNFTWTLVSITVTENGADLQYRTSFSVEGPDRVYDFTGWLQQAYQRKSSTTVEFTGSAMLREPASQAYIKRERNGVLSK